MRVHRFYVRPETELKHDFWLHDERLINQWRRVLRFSAGQELVLFDGVRYERLYKLAELTDKEAHLQLVTDYVRKLPKREVYMFWSLLKRGNNDWVLQKCTELGVSHFIPLLAERSEKTGFNLERAHKIVIETAEQCGRSDIPAVREPMNIETAIHDYKDKIQLLICQQSDDSGVMKHEGGASQISPPAAHSSGTVGVMIGPEGGWSDKEKQLFKEAGLGNLNLHDLTLRAETACVVAAAKLVQ